MSDISPLGQPVGYTGRYDPTLLFPIARAPQRESLGLVAGRLPFFGADQWTAYELSWLNGRGRPQIAIAHLTVPCETPNMIESKSLKLYLNSFSDTQFDGAEAVRERIRADVGEALGRGTGSAQSPGVRLVLPEAFERERIAEPEGLSLDRMDVECTQYQPDASLLSAAQDEKPVTEVLRSDLLKTNCPVTGQPDWGSVQIGYSGPQIDQACLLRYIVSFRGQQDFHEHCAERMFLDIQQRCRPTRLWLHARYTRRGGLDINPFRTSHPAALPANLRSARQ